MKPTHDDAKPESIFRSGGALASLRDENKFSVAFTGGAPGTATTG